MKRIILFVLLFAALKVAGQTTGYLRFDTVRIMKQNGTCELYIINKTKDSLGVLTNIGGGLTSFLRSRKINDTSFNIGKDTISGLGKNLANAALRATGSFGHKWDLQPLSIDSIGQLNLITRGSQFGLAKRSVIFSAPSSGFPLSLSAITRNAANSADSLTSTIQYSQNQVSIAASNTNGPDANIDVASGGTFSHITATADSIRAKLIPAATGDSVVIVGPFNPNTNTNTLFKAPFSGAGGGIPNASAYSYLGNVTASTVPVTSLHYSVFNVLDFGLVGDSATDNTAALRLLRTLVPEGSNIYFPAGKYLFSDTVIIRKSIRIYGDGYKAVPFQGAFFNMSYPSKAGTYLYFTHATRDFLIFDTTATNKAPIIQVEKLSIVNNAATLPSAGAAVVVRNNIGDGFMRDVTIERFFYDVNVIAACRFTMDHCNVISPISIGLFWQNTVLTDGGGLRVVNSSFIAGNDVNPSSAVGIHLKGGGAVDISHNWFNAKEIFNTPTEFKYPIFSDWFDGPTSGLQIAFNLIENFQDNGIRLRNHSGDVWYNVHIRGNSISPFKPSGAVLAAIDIVGFKNVTLTDNNGGNYYTASTESFIKLDSITNYVIYPGRDTGWTKHFTATNSFGKLQDAVLNPYLHDENTGVGIVINNINTGVNSNAGFVARAGSTIAEFYATSQNYGFGLAGAAVLQNMSGGDIALYTGSQALTVKNNGNVLVNGTTDNGYDLDVTGAGYVSSRLNIGSTTNNGYALDVTGSQRITGNLAMPILTGTNRSLHFTALDFGADNLGAVILAPSSGTNVGSSFSVSPKGTGFTSNFKSQIVIQNLDVVASPSDFESLVVRAAGNELSIGSIAGGAGTVRPLTLYTGSNTNQLLLNTDGTNTMSSLAGSGTRMVTATAAGLLGTQTIPSYTFTNGLTNSSGTVSLGGALTGTTSITGNFVVNMGTSGDPLSAFNAASSGRINLFGQVMYGTHNHSTDANLTVPANVSIVEIHDNITTNRTVTLPTAAAQGQVITIVVRASSNTDHFSLAAGIIDNKTGTTFTQLDWGTTYVLYVNGSVAWSLINKY